MKKMMALPFLLGSLMFVLLAHGSNTEKHAQRTPSSNDGTLSDATSKVLGNLLREANKKGNKNVKFGGGAQETTYSIGQDLICYFQNSDDSVSCVAGQ